MGYFIDTGILLRMVDRKSAAFSEIWQSLRLLSQERARLFTSTQNLREFWNVSTRPATSRGG